MTSEPTVYISEQRRWSADDKVVYLGWSWLLKAGNGRVLARSERNYPSPRAAQVAFDRMAALFDSVIDVQVWPW